MEVKEEEEPVTILQPCPNSSFLPPKLTRNDGGKNIPYRFLGAKLHRMGNTKFFWSSLARRSISPGFPQIKSGGGDRSGLSCLLSVVAPTNIFFLVTITVVFSGPLDCSL